MIEAEIYFGQPAMGGALVFPEPPSVLGDWTQEVEALEEGWFRFNVWVPLEPNPTWEDISWYYWTNEFEPGSVLLDHVHVATECTPEPASAFLLLLGAPVAYGVRRRRQTKQ